MYFITNLTFSWKVEYFYLYICTCMYINRLSNLQTFTFLKWRLIDKWNWIHLIFRYDWLKDGKLIDFTSNEVKYPNNTLRIYKEQGLGTLNIHRVQESDYGTYQCRASSDREDSQAVSLSKKVELIEAIISPFQDSSDVDSKKVPQGQYLMLTCDPPFSNPKATLSWTLDDTLREMDFNERIVMDYEGNTLVTSMFVGHQFQWIFVELFHEIKYSSQYK